MSDEFDGRVLNPNGVEIDLPFWVFKRLKKLRLLERDGATGKRRIKTQALEAFGACADWRAVYREECRNPGYVIENGKPSVRSASRLRRF